MASKMYPFINYRDSIHYQNSCFATIVIVKFLLSLSTIERCHKRSAIKFAMADTKAPIYFNVGILILYSKNVLGL